MNEAQWKGYIELNGMATLIKSETVLIWSLSESRKDRRAGPTFRTL